MIKKIIKYLFFTLLFLLNYNNLISQHYGLSVYSKYNITGKSYRGDAIASSMGGAIISLKKVGYVNIFNPASYSSIRFTSKSIGLSSSFLELNNKENSSYINSVNFSEAIIGIPIGNSGLVFGILPYNRSSYKIQTKPEDDKVNIYEGNGELNNIFLGYGLEIFEDFNLGLNISYVFGNIDQATYILRNNLYINSKLSNETNLKMLNFLIGGLYSFDIEDDTKLDIGLTINSKNNLSRSIKEILSSFAYNAYKLEVPLDTAYNRNYESLKNLSHMELGLGVSVSNKSWYIGLNYNWENPKKIDDSKESILHKISLGSSYVKDSRSMSYINRIEYRAGFYYKLLPITLDENQISDIGISIGLGLPLGDKLSKINLSLGLGQVGKVSNVLIKENYLNLQISILLNDIWFIKRIID